MNHPEQKLLGASKNTAQKIEKLVIAQTQVAFKRSDLDFELHIEKTPRGIKIKEISYTVGIKPIHVAPMVSNSSKGIQEIHDAFLGDKQSLGVTSAFTPVSFSIPEKDSDSCIWAKASENSDGSLSIAADREYYNQTNTA